MTEPLVLDAGLLGGALVAFALRRLATSRRDAWEQHPEWADMDGPAYHTWFRWAVLRGVTGMVIPVCLGFGLTGLAKHALIASGAIR